MSIKKKLNKNFFKKEYFNILYSLIMPSFVVGQVAFKIILILIILSSLISFNFKIFSINKNKLNFLFFVLILYLIFNSLLISNIYHEYNNRYLRNNIDFINMELSLPTDKELKVLIIPE